MQQVIGIRKMLVVICAIIAIAVILYTKETLTYHHIIGLSLIAGLGGFQAWNQGLIDKTVKKGP